MSAPPAPVMPGLRDALRTLLDFRSNPLAFFERLHRERGDLAPLRLGPRRGYALFHPELVRQVWVGQHREVIKSLPVRRSRILLGDGLLTSEGDFHLRQRRLAQPAFHRDRIAAYARTMVEDTRLMSEERWRDGTTVDAHREMMRLTLGIAGKTLFGAEVGEEEAEEIGRALDVAMVMFRRTTIPFSAILDRLPLPGTRRFFAARRRLDEAVFRMIEQRRASGEDAGDLLSMLIASEDPEGEGGRMSDRQLRDETLTIFLAGHETTANALAWSWYLLGTHPEAAARLAAEADEVLGDRAAGADDLPRLPFARAVLAESMRLYPPAWIIGREATAPLVVGGHTLPGGCTVFASPWVTHRDPRFWPEPERFLPERWMPEREGEIDRSAYLPFSTGPRKCIGEGFAWTEGTLVLVTLARQWRLHLLPGQRITPWPLITLRPRPGVMVRLERRG